MKSSAQFVLMALLLTICFPLITLGFVFREDVDDNWPEDNGDYILYVHTDHLGSSALLTEGAEKATHGGLRYTKGQVVQRIEYTPFGKERYVLNPSLEELPKYTGQTNDIDTDLYYYNSRYYDPVLGRFIQPDSVIPNIYQPQNLNPYAYVLNNPLKYIDPTGHFVDPDDNGAGLFDNAVQTSQDELNGSGTVSITNSFLNKEEQERQLELAYEFATGYVGGLGLVGKASRTSKVSELLGGRFKTFFERVKEFFGKGKTVSEIPGENLSNGIPASAPVGRKGAPLEDAPYQSTRNTNEVINGRRYTGHALDQAQNRGITPSVVEDAIRNGLKNADPFSGRTRNYSPENNITVITEGDDVITIIPGRR